MKLIFFLFTQLSLLQLFSQNLPPKDSIASILLVSHYHSIDKPILDIFKRNQDIIFFINVNDDDIFTFCDAQYDFYAKIKSFELDSSGYLQLIFTITHMRGSGEKIVEGEIKYKVGDECFFLTKNGKKTRHTDLKCEFYKDKIFNVDF